MCAPCREALRRLPPPGCRRCGAPAPPPEGGRLAPPAPAGCRLCAGWTSLGQARAALAFAGAVRAWIHELKYGGLTGLAALAADPLERAWRESPRELREATALVPVPLHPARLRERGFNQAELMAAELSRRTGVPVVPALTRSRPTVSQAGLAAVLRRENVRRAFLVPPDGSAFCSGRSLVLVDDVLTTGSTLDAAARALILAGAGSVHALAVARALPGGDA